MILLFIIIALLMLTQVIALYKLTKSLESLTKAVERIEKNSSGYFYRN